uniref:Beta-galactosidase n=1 Tax=Plectus sambesii TaxID=2011161 RepID=A0A914VTW2_9BILA
MRALLLLVVLCLLPLTFCDQSTNADWKPFFKIDYDNDQFLLDGKPYRYIAGSVHYFRIPPEYWLDRLAKTAAAGLNAIEFYVPWNFHEIYQGKYTFTGQANVTQFMDIAKELGLNILLRLGPYVCGEWENGGLPWWLLHTPDIRMRTSDPRFLEAVRSWYSVLLPKVVPYLRKNGGPVIMVQVENEYGSFCGCDQNYTIWIRDLFRSYFGQDTLLYTTDGGSEGYLKCGFVPEVYPTVDFGAGDSKAINSSFEAQRKFSAHGPLVNSEFYPGWLVLWGQNGGFNLPSIQEIVKSSKYMYDLGASFNYYMFHGGTNFGYWNGAETQAPVITSYDYSAPLTEAGDPTPKYYAIRDWIGSLSDWPYKPSTVPPATKKRAYGQVTVQKLGTILDLADVISTKCTASEFPLTFEQMNHPFGFVLYRTKLPSSGTNLTASGLKDHGFVMVNYEYQGTMYAAFGNRTNLSLNITAKQGATLSILVENRGRQTYETINDMKGLTRNVTLDGVVLTDWQQCGVNLLNIFKHMKRPAYRPPRRATVKAAASFLPTIYVGKFSADTQEDTFFNPTGWGKGQYLLNKFNVGRYWPSIGPQITLYTPKSLLQSKNTIVMLELEHMGDCEKSNPNRCLVRFDDAPIINVTYTETRPRLQPEPRGPICPPIH